MSEKDVEVSLSGNAVMISGEKKEEIEEKEEGYYRVERSYGTFQRSIALPVEVDRDKVEGDVQKRDTLRSPSQEPGSNGADEKTRSTRKRRDRHTRDGLDGKLTGRAHRGPTLGKRGRGAFHVSHRGADQATGRPLAWRREHIIGLKGRITYNVLPAPPR